jgi:hypothetical protein
MIDPSCENFHIMHEGDLRDHFKLTDLVSCNLTFEFSRLKKKCHVLKVRVDPALDQGMHLLLDCIEQLLLYSAI